MYGIKQQELNNSRLVEVGWKKLDLMQLKETARNLKSAIFTVLQTITYQEERSPLAGINP